MKLGFGWGTLLTNDFRGLAAGLAPFSGLQGGGANGRPAVKLSDNPAKAIGPADEMARYRRVSMRGLSRRSRCWCDGRYPRPPANSKIRQ